MNHSRTRRKPNQRRASGRPTKPEVRWILLAAMLAAAALVYWQALAAGFIWDDDDYVTANATLRSLAGLGQIWFQPGATPQYYPIVHTSFWLEHHLWQDWAPGYHTVNVVLHAINAFLVGVVLRRLSVPGAWLAAVLFLVHPVEVESVAWITERKNTLSLFFYLLAAIAYIKFLAGRQAGDRWYQGRGYLAALALFVAALLCKTVACTLPAALLIVVWWQRGRITRADLLPTLPFFAVGAALAGVTVYLERYRVGAVGQDWEFSAVDRILIAGRALWFYPAKIVWPRPLTFIYPRWHIDAGQWWQSLFPLAAIAAIALLVALRDRVGRGPAAALLFFVVTIAPALGLVNIYPMRYTFAADHYQYVACLGLLVPAAVALTWLSGRLARYGRFAAAALPCVLVFGLAMLSRAQAGVYRDPVTLWTDTLAKNPQCWMAYNNLGIVLAADPIGLTSEKLAELDRLFDTAIQLNATSPETWNSLASLRLIEGRAKEAAACAAEAMQLEPEFAAAHSNYGSALAQQGDWKQAEDEFQTAIRLRPSFAEAHGNLANVLVQRRDVGGALAEYQRALALKPDYYVARLNLALVLAENGRLQDSLQQYQRLLGQVPQSARLHYELGNLRLKLRQNTAAEAEFIEALRLDPRHSGAHNNLGGLLQARGDSSAAVRHFAQAVEADPANASAKANLARARALRP